MKIINSLVTFSILCLLPSSLTFGSSKGNGFIINPAAHYWKAEKQLDNIKVTQDLLLLNIGLGYKFGNQIYTGVKYLSWTTSENAGTTERSGIRALGASLGYLSDSGFNIIGTYNISHENTHKQGQVTQVLSGGTSYLLDVGYFWYSGSVGFGPQITYHSFEWTDVENTAGGQTVITKLNTPFTDTLIYPYLALIYSF